MPARRRRIELAPNKVAAAPVAPAIHKPNAVARKNNYDQIRRRLRTIGNGVSLGISSIEDAGWGLFADQDFSAGSVITKYEGIIRTPLDVKLLSLDEQTHLKGLGTITSHYIVDGRYLPSTRELIVNPPRQLARRGGGAMANHSSRNVNAEFDFVDTPVYSDKVARWHEFSSSPFPHPGPNTRLGRLLFLRATRDIARGDEILVNYGREYACKHGILY